MLHKWGYAGVQGILGAIWLANPMKVALMKPAWVPNYDAAMSFSALQAANEIAAGTGYVAGGLALAGKAAPYDGAADRTNLQAVDSVWGPGATFGPMGFAALYDDSHVNKLIWSVVDFEGSKSVDNGTFTIDWAAISLLHLVPA